MNHYLVEKFRNKLNCISISDYYGLNSPGLTCYLNSVLQVLFMTEDFREAIKRYCSKDSTTSGKIDLHLGRLFTDLEKSTAKTHRITKTLGIKDIYKQRDAAEYFEKILCLTNPEASKIFKGELNHMTTCIKCKDRNDCRSFFWTLPLAVENSSDQIYSVEKGLKAFFKEEKVCGDNKMYCDCCSKKQDADFECQMTQNPEILTLLLKRFSFDDKRRCYFKLYCEVDVPQTLHMESCTYDLYALVNHFGNLMGGHYTSQIKSFETGAWYQFDDHTVKSVELSLRSCTAYLLMYRKVNKHPQKTDEGNQEGHFPHSDVKSEGRHDKAEKRGGAPLPCHQLKDDSCNGGKNLNGDILKQSDDDTVWKKVLNISGELEKQTNQRAAYMRSHKKMLPQTDSAADGDSYRTSLQKSNFAMPEKDKGQKRHGPNRQQHAATNAEEHIYHLNTRETPMVHFRKHSDDSMLEQNHNSLKKRLKANGIVWETQRSIVTKTGIKTSSVTDSNPIRNTVKLSETIGVKDKRDTVAEVSIERTSIKQKRDTGIRANMGDRDVKSFHVSSNGCSSSCLQSLSALALKEHTEYNSPSLCRKSSNLKRNKEKLQAAQTVTNGENTVSLKQNRNAKKSYSRVKKDPWR